MDGFAAAAVVYSAAGTSLAKLGLYREKDPQSRYFGKHIAAHLGPERRVFRYVAYERPRHDVGLLDFDLTICFTPNYEITKSRSWS